MKLSRTVFTTGALAALVGGNLMAGYAAETLATKGTIVAGTLGQRLSSKTNHDGDPFSLTEKDTFFHKNPALHGGVIEGHLENVTPASPTHRATMSVIFDDVKMPDGTTLPIRATVLSLSTFEPHTHHIRDVGLIVGGAVVGHLAANKAAHGHGGLAGAAAGFALASSLKSDIVVRDGTLVKLRLTEDLATGS